MAEVVQKNLELMLPDLEELERTGIFSAEEIKCVGALHIGYRAPLFAITQRGGEAAAQHGVQTAEETSEEGRLPQSYSGRAQDLAIHESRHPWARGGAGIIRTSTSVKVT